MTSSAFLNAMHTSHWTRRSNQLSSVPSAAHQVDATVIEVYIVLSANPPSNVGEPGTPPIAPAVANAARLRAFVCTGCPSTSPRRAVRRGFGRPKSATAPRECRGIRCGHTYRAGCAAKAAVAAWDWIASNLRELRDTRRKGVGQEARLRNDLRETQTALLRAAGGSANNVAAGRLHPVSVTALVSLLRAAQVFGQAPPGQPQQAASCHPECTGYASSRNRTCQ